MQKKTKNIAFAAVFAAIAFIANIWTIPLPNSNWLSFVYIPTFLAGIFLGPLWGFIVGFSADLLAGIVVPKGAYMITIGLASGMLGAIPGLVYKHFKCNHLLKLAASLLLTMLVCTVGLNTTTLWVVYNQMKTPYIAYIIVRVPWQMLIIAVNFLLIAALTQIKAVVNYFPETKHRIFGKKEVVTSAK